MLGNGAYFAAMFGTPPAPCVCDSVEELAEWFRLTAVALRVQRLQARPRVTITIHMPGTIRATSTTVRVRAETPLETRARAGRMLPGVRR